MKKTLLLLCTFAIITASVTAQISFGPIAGLNLTSYSTKFPGRDKQSTPLENQVLDMQVGAIADLPFSKRFHLQSGLLFTTNSYKYEGPEAVLGKYSVYTNIRSLELPVDIMLYTRMKHRGQFFFSAGAFLACNVSGRTHTKNVQTITDSSSYGVTVRTHVSETEEKLKFGNNKPDDNYNKEYNNKRFGAGIDLNAGYQHKSGIFARVHYQKGLINQVAFSGPKTTSSNFGVSLGYFFHAKKKEHTENKEKL